jgi:hypothetical protein
VACSRRYWSLPGSVSPIGRVMDWISTPIGRGGVGPSVFRSVWTLRPPRAIGRRTLRRSIARHEVLVYYDDVVGVVIDGCKPKGAEAEADRRNADAERTSLSRIDIKL